MTEQQTLAGSPLASGIQYGPYRTNGLPVYNIATPLLWGGGRTDMYWRGPAPSDLPAPTLFGNAGRTGMAILFNITGVKGQPPFEYLLNRSTDGVNFSYDENATTLQGNVGGNIQFVVTGLTPATTYYYTVTVINGFSSTYSPVSAGFMTTA